MAEQSRDGQERETPQCKANESDGNAEQDPERVFDVAAWRRANLALFWAFFKSKTEG